MAVADMLDRGRASYARQSWGSAKALLSAADRGAALAPEDLERLAIAAYLMGDDDACADAWQRAHQALIDRGDVTGAARCAFWVGWGLFYKGQMARCGGWFARAQRLVDEYGDECVEQGLLLVPDAVRQLGTGEVGAAHATFDRVGRIGDRFGDADLRAFSLLGRGQALIRLDRVDEGVQLLDEAMVAVTVGEVSPVVAGTVYCRVLLECQLTFDLARAQEWTAALSDWCDSEPGMVPYRGQCLVHRSELLQLRGAWSDAVDEARRARDLLLRPPPQPAAGLAFYQEAELHRLRGEFADAEDAYRRASEWGHDPQPGLALLRLAQGQVHSAQSTIRRVMDEVRDRTIRTRMQAAHAEIMVAAGDLPAARAAADELSAAADAFDAPLLHAEAAHTLGMVLLAEGDPGAALDDLRRSCDLWQELDAPHQIARVRVLIGRACKQLGDDDTARLELEAARAVFEEVGATPDLATVNHHRAALASEPVGGLTAREVEVLRLVAAGMTNRAVGDELVISDKTVERHLSNLYRKLRVPNRAAATAYAHEHGLV